jgi:hypothetical protein
MGTPQNLAGAKAIFREQKLKLTNSLSAVAGSRWLLALLATLVIAFGANLLYSPSQLPAIGGLSLSAIGLPPSLDWGVLGEQAAQAGAAAQRQGAPTQARAFLDQYARYNPILNAAGFGLCLLLLLGNMWIMTKRRRFSRG